MLMNILQPFPKKAATVNTTEKCNQSYSTKSNRNNKLRNAGVLASWHVGLFCRFQKPYRVLPRSIRGGYFQVQKTAVLTRNLKVTEQIACSTQSGSLQRLYITETKYR